ncbi:sigma-70 family RNA polymerase sigma factor [Nocardioides sp. SLBN-35]|uniref:sigma-70 family RNA polymerase sigma factor n=1 Tax=Nocardioides sp. SLBN-35 TaxID=2768445 RepID=UPI0011730CCA|nr:sigma-70 family RNA polymerase sigma factor [Nocardioides sp. SLBN-35]TQK73290.1 RNA polymerase sigma factor (sigma-70 family) [Nocardioides sp. SLBN-35]
MEFHSEEELLDQVRQGDEAAFGVLFVRHRGYAFAVARRTVGERDAEDVVAEAFERIFAILKGGRGPTTTFRPYLSVTVHNVAVNKLRGRSREVTTEPADLIPLLVTDDTSGKHLTSGVVREAFAALPARWQQVLWLCEVDRVPHDEVGELLGIKANAVAALAMRARRGLADAYLAQYAQSADSTECKKVVGYLPGYVNGHLTRARRETVERHLRTCKSCPVAILELGEARRDVGALLAPLVVSLAATGAVGATAAGGIDAVVSSSFGKAVTGVLASTAVAGVVAGVALVAIRSPEPNQTAAPVTPAPTHSSEAADPVTPAAPRPTRHRAPHTKTGVVEETPTPVEVTSAARKRPADQLEYAEVEKSPVASKPPRAESAPQQPGSDPSATDPTPTDPTTPPTRDPRLGTPVLAGSPSGPAWRRVTIQVDGDGQAVQVALGGVGATNYCVSAGGATDCASRAQHGPWSDLVTVGSGITQVILDVKVAHTTYLTFAITRVDGRDADLGNNDRAIAVPSPGWQADGY